ncbi:MAG: hypothetical protein JKY52_07910 [Flavobacteriales bacterium]|nr:hypothetical protein [Flavobacteriales bacterium]
MSDDKNKDDDKLLYCSFCGKSQHEVKKDILLVIGVMLWSTSPLKKKTLLN